MVTMDKISLHKHAFETEKLSPKEIAECIEEKAPQGVLLEKWTKDTVQCPSCSQKSLDKFVGGANVKEGHTTYTEFFYDCRVCSLNLTEEEYQATL